MLMAYILGKQISKMYVIDYERISKFIPGEQNQLKMEKANWTSTLECSEVHFSHIDFGAIRWPVEGINVPNCACVF